MHRLGLLRVSFGAGSSGIRARPSVSRAAASAGRALSCIVDSTTPRSPRPQENSNSNSSSSNSSSSRYLSTSTNKKYKDIPKRIYQSAPKRSHGKHAGMKKWSGGQNSKAPAEAVATPQAGEGEDVEEGDKQLASGKVWGSRKAEELREVKTGLKEIRVSPWSLNLLAKLVRGLPVVDATAQLKFCKKKHTITVNKAIQNALNLADMRYGLGAEELEVGEIFVTKGKVVKRMRIMGRGRAGIMRRKWSHLNVTLREIDFDKQIETAASKNRREKLQARKEEVEQLRVERGEQAYAEPV